MSDHRAPEPASTGPETPGPVVDTPSDQELPEPVLDQKRPEPVLDAAKLAGTIAGIILAVGGLLKLLTPWVPADYDLQHLADTASDAVLSLGVAWATLGPWVTARLRARDKVTPLADPRDGMGRRLTPAS